MSILDQADQRRAGSSAMAGAIGEHQALAAIVLWNSGHFDTVDIGKLLDLKEDAIVRTLHAARHVIGGKRP
jgi:hypothetical protein